jgi:hypothetical protein
LLSQILRAKCVVQNRFGAVERVEADQQAAERQEGLMDLVVALVADRHPPVAVEPVQRPLHDPAVPAQAVLGLDSLAGDADLDAALGQGAAAAGDVVGLVGVQLGRAPAAPTRQPARADDGRDRVDQGKELGRIVGIDRRHPDR